tara:strand:- start:15998 stop:16675 length:678 start_codon:yes stop_codon:yes gene_type:complete
MRGVVFEVRKIKTNYFKPNEIRVSILTEENTVEYFIGNENSLEIEPFEEVIIEKNKSGDTIKVSQNENKETFIHNKKIPSSYIKKRFSFNPFKTYKKNKAFIKKKILELFIPEPDNHISMIPLIIFILFMMISFDGDKFDKYIYSLCFDWFGTRNDDLLTDFQWNLASFSYHFFFFFISVFSTFSINFIFLILRFFKSKYIFQVDIENFIGKDKLKIDFKSHLWL